MKEKLNDLLYDIRWVYLHRAWEWLSWHFPFVPRRVVIVVVNWPGCPSRVVGAYRSFMTAMHAICKDDAVPKGYTVSFITKKV